MLTDLRFALRGLRRAPLFAASAIAALALGIGANTAVFSVVYAVLLKPLPYPQPNRLVQLSERNPSKPSEYAVVSAGTFVDWRTRSHALERVAVYAPNFGNGETVWNIGDRAMIVKTAAVSPSIFSVLGVQPILGRGLRPETEKAPDGTLGQFVIGYGLWQRAFGGAPDIVGRRIELEGHLPREIVGVMPRGFDFPDGFEAWTSVRLASVPVAKRLAARQTESYEAIGRLAPGVTIDDLRRELTGISAQLAVEYPASNAGWVPDVEPASNSNTASARLALLALLAAVGGVLLIACANVANLLLARVASRRDEMTVRIALGASTGRLIRQSLSEASLLAGGGLATGLLVGRWVARALVTLAPPDIVPSHGVALNGPVLAFSVVACAMCVAVIGLAPALHVARSVGSGGVRADLRSATAHGARLRRWIIGAEAAVVVLLLTGALLFLRTFTNLRHVDLGFQPDHTLAVEARWPVGYLLQSAPGTKPWPRVQRATDGMVKAVEATPGVEAAGLVTDVPLGSDPAAGTVWRLDAPGASATTPPVDTRERWHADLNVVTPGYFRAMDLTFLRGRNFTNADRYTDDELQHAGPLLSGVAIVNSVFAAKYFPGAPAVGHVIASADASSFGATRTIVGVVTDIRQRSVAEAPRPMFFIPGAQEPDIIRPSFVVRTSLPFAAVAPVIRDRLREFDPQLVVLDIRPMNDIIAGALSRPRFNLLLIGVFAALGLALAAIGLYGVVSFVTTQRTREIGIRVALGARAADVLRLLVADGMRPVLAGVLVGLVADVGATRLLGSMLYGVTPLDPLSVAGAAAALAIVAVIACYLPARRALRVDPVRALADQ
ncbi:MAG: ABC transporter permease [Vicinamibacterales bacterium]